MSQDKTQLIFGYLRALGDKSPPTMHAYQAILECIPAFVALFNNYFVCLFFLSSVVHFVHQGHNFLKQHHVVIKKKFKLRILLFTMVMK